MEEVEGVGKGGRRLSGAEEEVEIRSDCWFGRPDWDWEREREREKAGYFPFLASPPPPPPLPSAPAASSSTRY